MEISPKNVFGRYRFQYRLMQKVHDMLMKRSLEEVNQGKSIVMDVSKYPRNEAEAVRQILEERGFRARIRFDDQGTFTRRVNQYKEEVVQYERVLLSVELYDPVEPLEDVNNRVELSVDSRPFYKGPQ